jgi:FkbM family methyltransferase
MLKQLELWIRRWRYRRYFEQRDLALEEAEFPLLDRFIHPGDRVVDIGANMGLYAKRMAQLVGTSGHVTAIEPLPPIFEILERHMRDFPQVSVVHAAVYDHRTEVTMQIPTYPGTHRENWYESHIIPAENVQSDRRQFTVQAMTLDDLVTEPVKFIKCDIEGAEMACLRGAQRILVQDRPTWLIEIKPENYADAVHVFDENGYSGYVVENGVLVAHRPGMVNYFFLPS